MKITARLVIPAPLTANFPSINSVSIEFEFPEESRSIKKGDIISNLPGLFPDVRISEIISLVLMDNCIHIVLYGSIQNSDFHTIITDENQRELELIGWKYSRLDFKSLKAMFTSESSTSGKLLQQELQKNRPSNHKLP